MVSWPQERGYLYIAGGYLYLEMAAALHTPASSCLLWPDKVGDAHSPGADSSSNGFFALGEHRLKA